MLQRPTHLITNKEDKENKEEGKKPEEEKKEAKNVFAAKPKDTNVFAKKEDNKEEAKAKEDKGDKDTTIQKKELSSAAKSRLDNKTLESIIYEWNDKLDLYTEGFKKQAGQLRNQELVLYELTDKSMELEIKSREVLSEFAHTESTVTEVEKQQERLMKELDELDSKLDRYTHKRHFSSEPSIRSEISEKSLNVNLALEQMNKIIQDVNKGLGMFVFSVIIDLSQCVCRYLA